MIYLGGLNIIKLKKYLKNKNNFKILKLVIMKNHLILMIH